MALAPIITRDQLESRVSKLMLDRALSAGSNEADEDAVAQILYDASSKVRGKIGQVGDLSEFDSETATELVRICLDVAHAYLAIRHPEVVRQDGFKMMKMAEADLKEIRIGQADLGTEEPPDLKMGARVRSRQSSRGWDREPC